MLNGKSSIFVSLLACGVLNALPVFAAVAPVQKARRIAAPAVESMNPEQKKLNDEFTKTMGSLVGLRHVLVNDMELVKIWSDFSGALSAKMQATNMREYGDLVLITVGRYWTDSWSTIRHSSGIEPDVLAALMDGRIPTFKKDNERVVYEYVSELLNNRTVSDVTYKRAWDLLGTQGLATITMYVGFSEMLSLQQTAHKVPMPAGPGKPFEPFR